MVSLSRSICLGLFLAALGLAGATLAAAQPKEPNGGGQTAQPPQSPPDARAALAEPPAANSANQARSEKPKPKPPTIGQRVWRWVWRFGRDPIAVLTLALFALGGWQVEISRRTAKAQLRAYLIAYPKGVADTPDGGHQSMVAIVNTGQTPAYNVSGFCGVAIHLLGEPFDPVPLLGDPINLTDMMIGPGRDFTFCSKFDALEEGDQVDIRDERRALFVFGYVRYHDAFNKTRVTSFCHYYRGEVLDEAAGKYWNSGNSAT